MKLGWIRDEEKDRKGEIKICQNCRCKKYNRASRTTGRPLPKNKLEASKFEKLINEYVKFSSTSGDRGIILAITGSNVIGLVSFVILDRLNQPTKEYWIPDLIVLKEYRNHN